MVATTRPANTVHEAGMRPPAAVPIPADATIHARRRVRRSPDDRPVRSWLASAANCRSSSSESFTGDLARPRPIRAQPTLASVFSASTLFVGEGAARRLMTIAAKSTARPTTSNPMAPARTTLAALDVPPPIASNWAAAT